MKKTKAKSVVKTVKIENHLDAEQVAGFLRALADELEGNREGGLQRYGIDLSDINRMKLGLRRGEAGELFLKIKLKDGGRAKVVQKSERPKKEGAEDPQRMEYRVLKKRMKAGFAAIGRAIAAKQLPDSSDIRLFLDDSRKMTEWHGFGDPFYEEYNGLCRAFASAFAAADMAGLAEGHRNLAACMKRCHGRFKS